MNLQVRQGCAESSLSEPNREQLGSVALDQWRGLALVLVLVSHGFFFTGRVNGIGRVGVNLFFFISGILVFRSLSRSHATSNWDRTRLFWWRRFRRLYPALITYVLAMLPVVWAARNLPDLPPGSNVDSYLRALPAALLYGTNYFHASPLSLSHLWSLACEMQFYVLAPLIYWLGGSGARRRNAVFGVFLVVFVALGVSQPVLARRHPIINEWKYHFEFAVWPMMVGFVCEYQRERILQLPLAIVKWAFWTGIVGCGASLAIMLAGMEMKVIVIASGALVLAPCLVAYLFGRAMPGAPGRAFRWLGERTYSIYLWQQPLTICQFLPNALHPFGAAAAAAVGGIWFHWFERPFLSATRNAATLRPGKRSLRSRIAVGTWF